MIRKLLLGLLGLVVLAAAGFFLFAPRMAEESMNKIDGEPLIAVSEEAKALHATLTIVDLHADTLLWKRSLLADSDRGHVDLGRLRQGNVALQVFSSVTNTPKGQNYDSNSADGDNITLLTISQLQPVHTWFSILERGLCNGEKLQRAAADSGNALWPIRSGSDLEKLIEAVECGDCTKIGEGPYATAAAGKPLGALFSAEGLHSLEGDPDNLDKLYDAGLRMAGLTHFFDNELAGSMHGEEKGGLTPMGREVVRRMEDKGIIVDIAHCSHQCVAEVLAMARRPVVSRHGGVQATCDVNRNLTDDEIRGVAATGGVIGVGYWEGAVCSTDPRATAHAMKHIRDLVGIEHVALGSDYDGAVTVRFDTSQLTQVTQALIDEGFSEEEIRAAMGLNALRVLQAGLNPMKAAQ